jgi:Flp pilus assembly protein TadG
MTFFPTRRYRRFQREDAGSELVEFALSCTVLLMLVFSISECSLALYANHFVSYAASQGARYAMVRGTTWTTGCSSKTPALPTCLASSDNVQAYIRSIAPGGITSTSITASATYSLPNNGSSCTGSCCATPSPGCIVQVQVTYPFNLQMPFIPITAVHLTSTAAVAIEQ